jgi:hypothetical protein
VKNTTEQMGSDKIPQNKWEVKNTTEQMGSDKIPQSKLIVIHQV